jgi:glutamyl-tRNA synthetase
VTEILRSRDTHLPRDFEERLARTVPLVKDGAKTTLELADLCLFALPHRPPLDDRTRKLLGADASATLGRLAVALAAVPRWTCEALAEAIKAFADSEGGGIGRFGPALRAILAAGHVAPDLASALVALGREESLGRIEDALSPGR